MFIGKALPPLSLVVSVCHGYNYHFLAYPCRDCSCDPVYTADNFGCYNTCHIMNQRIESVGLKKDSRWDPRYPTADLNAGLGCGGARQHAKIGNLQTLGCTNVDIDNRALGIQLWYGC